MLNPNARPGAALILALLLSGISGCAQFDEPRYWFAENEPTEPQMPTEQQIRAMELDKNGIRYRSEQRDGALKMEYPTAVYQTPNQLYRSRFTHKGIDDYAEQLSMELLDNARQLNGHSRVGVASFVMLDSTLNRSDVLGNQLAEVFIHQLQEFGLAVVDFKTMNSIHVQDHGDFVFSRNTYRLANKLNMDYVLSGTMVRNERGVKLHARIVSMEDKVVVSSASVMVPHFIVAQLMPSYVVLPDETSSD